ncbi:MAG TPA: cupredoxin family copper-binding protein [Methylomirabilota bacterium]|jgi:plastocyanin
MKARIRSTSWITAVVTLAAVTLSAGRPAGAAPAAVTVEITDFAFQPGTVTVAPGTTVTWHNDDEESHTITSTEGVFKSEALEGPGRFSFTFTKAGTYHYFCALHPHMRADVIVR